MRKFSDSMKIVVLGASGHGKTAWIARAIYEWAVDLSEDDPTRKTLRNILNDNENNRIPESSNIGEYSHHVESGLVSVVWQDIAGSNLLNPHALEKIKSELLPKAHAVIWVLDVKEGMLALNCGSTAPVNSVIERIKLMIQARWNKAQQSKQIFPVWVLYTKKDTLPSDTSPDYPHCCQTLQQFAQRIHPIPLNSADAYFIGDTPSSPSIFDLVATTRQYKSEWHEKIVPAIQKFYTKVAVPWKKNIMQQQRIIAHSKRWLLCWLFLAIYFLFEFLAYHNFESFNKANKESLAGDSRLFAELRQNTQGFSLLVSFYCHRRAILTEKLQQAAIILQAQNVNKLENLCIKLETPSSVKWGEYISDLDRLYEDLEAVQDANKITNKPINTSQFEQQLSYLDDWINLIHPDWKDDTEPDENLKQRIQFLVQLPNNIQPLRNCIVKMLTQELKNKLDQITPQTSNAPQTSNTEIRHFAQIVNFDKFRIFYEDIYKKNSESSTTAIRFSDDFSDIVKDWQEKQTKNWEDAWRKNYDTNTPLNSSELTNKMKALINFYDNSQGIKFVMENSVDTSYQMWPKQIYDEWFKTTIEVLLFEEKENIPLNNRKKDLFTKEWKDLIVRLPLENRLKMAEHGFVQRMEIYTSQFFVANKNDANRILIELESEYNNHQKDCDVIQKQLQEKFAKISQQEQENKGIPITPKQQEEWQKNSNLEKWRKNFDVLKSVSSTQNYQVQIEVYNFGCLNPDPKLWKEGWDSEYFYLKFLPNDDTTIIIDLEGHKSIPNCSLLYSFKWHPWQKMAICWMEKDGAIDSGSEQDDDKVYQYEVEHTLSLRNFCNFKVETPQGTYWFYMSIKSVNPPFAPELLELWNTYGFPNIGKPSRQK